LIDLIRQGFFRRDEAVLFWHTGGIPALFAEPYASALARLVELVENSKLGSCLHLLKFNQID
jgi:hypothetical protein